MIIYNIPKKLRTYKKRGSPKGSRLHWFSWLYCASPLKNKYELIYDYRYDNYIMISSGKRPKQANKSCLTRYYDLEIYVISRTSKECYRCMYADVMTGRIKYFSSKNANKILNNIEENEKEKAMPGEEP